MLFVLVENDRAGGAGISVVIFGLLLQFLGGVDVFGTIWNNPVYILVFLALYLVAGTVWAVSKWYIFVKKIARKYREIKTEFLHSRKLEPGDPLDDKQRAELLRQARDSGIKEVPPRANSNKSRIIGWMVFWPISLVWSLLDDFVKELFTQVYDFIGGFLQRISNRVFKDIVDDFKE